MLLPLQPVPQWMQLPLPPVPSQALPLVQRHRPLLLLALPLTRSRTQPTLLLPLSRSPDGRSGLRAMKKPP